MVLHAEKSRLYADTQNLGDPLVWLEDEARLKTGQKRPAPRIVQKAESVGRHALEKIRKHLTRIRRIAAINPQQEIHHHGVQPDRKAAYGGLER